MKLTKAEKAWVAVVQAALDKCPSTRLGFATTGGHAVSIFDSRGYMDIADAINRSSEDFLPAAERLGLVAMEQLRFPQQVESTAG